VARKPIQAAQKVAKTVNPTAVQRSATKKATTPSGGDARKKSLGSGL
tara:strand:- start:1087 stop:1227 length:141 start_codon:yes stop_codon:yes gene_type:complete